MYTKTCYKCKAELSINLFDKKSSSKDGYDSICKKCKSKQHKEYREKNKNALKEKSKQYRLDNADVLKEKKREYYKTHKDEILKKCAEYQKTHKEQKAANDKRYAQENKEKIQKYQKEYRDTHKLSNAEYQKQYRIKNKDKLEEYKKSPHTRYKVYQSNATNKGRVFDITEDDFYTITTKPCVYCGGYSDTYNGKPFNGIDRIDSNLGYFIDNCVPCCTTCNRMKMDMAVNDWFDKMKQILANYDNQILHIWSN